MDRLRRPGFWLAVLGLAGCAALCLIGPCRPDRPWAPGLLLGYSLAWLCYLAAALVITRARGSSRRVLLWIVVVALGLRVVAFLHRVPMSTDSVVYLCQGELLAHGYNPYQAPPEVSWLEQTAEMRQTATREREGHSLYPPGTELLFGGLAWAGGGDRRAFLWAFVLFDVGNVLLLMTLLRRTGRDPAHAIWYAWCPLPVVETASGGHVDAVGLFFLLLALLLAARREGRAEMGGAVAYAASLLLKGPAIYSFPFFVRRGGWRFAVAVALLCGLALVPFATAGRDIFAGLAYYTSYWEKSRMNAGVFLLLDWLLHLVTPHHLGITRAVTTLLLLGVMVVLLRRHRPGMAWLIGTTFGVQVAQLVLGMPVLPWYALWCLPLLCWWPTPGLVLLTYVVFAQYYARWIFPHAYPAPLLLGWVPVCILLLQQWRTWRRREQAEAPPAQSTEASNSVRTG